MRISNSIADLRQQIHDDLRIQHPEWVQLNGESRKCDFYEARLTELLLDLEGKSSTKEKNHERKTKEKTKEIHRHGASVDSRPRHGRQCCYR